MFRRFSWPHRVIATCFITSAIALSVSDLPLHATDGHRDTAFGTSGVASVSIAPSGDTTSDVAVQNDGKIIVAGSGSFPAGSGGYDFVLTRFNSDGTLDSDFGVNGIVTTDFYSNSTDELYAIAIQPDGRILATGSSNYGGHTDIAVSRYNTDGSLDSGFDGDGKLFLISQNPSSQETGMDILVQPNGKIVIVGQSFNSVAGFSQPFVIRINSNGNSTDFITVINTGQPAIANAGALQQDGKILLAGVFGNNPYQLAIWRVDSSGQLDASFGASSFLLVPQASSAQSIAVQTDGKIVVGGTTGTSPSWNSAILRFSANGVLDTTFSGDGIFENSFSNGDDYISDIVLRPTGQIVAVGAISVSNVDSSLILQVTSSGVLDTTYSGDGYQVVTIGSNESSAVATALQNDGKVLLAAVAYFGSTADLAVLRLNPPSTISTLSGLSVAGASLAQTFSSSTTSYTTAVAHTISSVTITPTASHANATVTINGSAVTSGTASAALSLAVGANVIPVVVTAQDAITQTTYTITVTRAAAETPTSNTSGGTTATTTTTAPPTSNTSGGTTTTTTPIAQPTVKVKKSITAKALLASRSVKLPSTSKVEVAVKASSKKVCGVNGTKVTGLKKGNCTVIIAVTPKATKTVKKPKTTRTTVTLRVM